MVNVSAQQIVVSICAFFAIAMLLQVFKDVIFKSRDHVSFFQIATSVDCKNHREKVANDCPSCMNGYCFLGKCFCNAGFIGPDCKPDILFNSNCEKDMCFFSNELGVPSVSATRWMAAQKSEAELWAECKTCSDDGGDHHASGFDEYRSLTGPIGHYIELGCGPFTQTKHIFGPKRPDLLESMTTLTLLDPNIIHYVQNVKKVSYSSGKLLNKNVILIGGPSESFALCEHFDTLTVINVAEHVQNIYHHFETIYYALKDRGQLIFHDRAWNTYKPDEHYLKNPQDFLFHPTRSKSPVFEHFLSFFDMIYCSQHVTNDELKPTAFYFVGRKKARLDIWRHLYENSEKQTPLFKCSKHVH